MTPKQLKANRKKLGFSARQMAKQLGVPGEWADRTIRRWEVDGNDVPGPVAVSVQFMIDVHTGKLVRRG